MESFFEFSSDLDKELSSPFRGNSEYFSQKASEPGFNSKLTIYEFESLETCTDLTEIQPLEPVFHIKPFSKLIFIPNTSTKCRKMDVSYNVLNLFISLSKEPKPEYVRMSIMRAMKKIFRVIFDTVDIVEEQKNSETQADIENQRNKPYQEYYFNEERISHCELYSALQHKGKILILNLSRKDQVSALEKLVGLARDKTNYFKVFSKTSSGPLTENKKNVPAVRNKAISKSKRRVAVARKKKNLATKKRSNLPTKQKFNTFNHSWVEHYFQEEKVRDAYKFFIDYLFAGKTMDELKITFKFYCCTNLHENFEDCCDKWSQFYKFCLNQFVFCEFAESDINY